MGAHGGGKRIEQILRTVTQHSPDLIAFAEYRVAPGKKLVEALGHYGWKYDEFHPRTRCAGFNLDFPDHGFRIGVLHIVCAGRSGDAKKRFWNAGLASAQRVRDDPFLFVGDLNTGSHWRDEAGRTFKCAEQFGQMTELG